MSTKEKKPQLTDIDGVGPAAEDKLHKAGLFTVEAVAVSSVAEIAGLVGSKPTALKIVNSARELANIRIAFWGDRLKKEARRWYVETGSEELDKLLGGRGVESGQTVELYGAFASGKTQFALQLLVNVLAMFHQKGEHAVVVIIDTEGTSRPQRIRQMIGALNEENKENKDWKSIPLDEDYLNQRIGIMDAYTTDLQMFAVMEIEKLIEEQGLPIKAVLEDSLMNRFRGEYVGRGTLAERQQKLNKHLQEIGPLVDRHNILYLFTNQVMAKPDQFYGNPEAPIGGNIVAHFSGVRLGLRKGSKGNKASLVDSSHLPKGDAMFQITLAGIRDPDWDPSSLGMSLEEFEMKYPCTWATEEKTEKTKKKSKKTQKETPPATLDEVAEGETVEEEA